MTKPVTIELPGIVAPLRQGPPDAARRSRRATSTYRDNNVAGAGVGDRRPGVPEHAPRPDPRPAARPDGLAARRHDAVRARRRTRRSRSRRAPAPSRRRRPRAATLPSARRCLVAARRSASACAAPARRPHPVGRVTVNGKRVKVRRGKRLRALVDLRGLPRGHRPRRVTVRTDEGQDAPQRAHVPDVRAEALATPLSTRRRSSSSCSRSSCRAGHRCRRRCPHRRRGSPHRPPRRRRACRCRLLRRACRREGRR